VAGLISYINIVVSLTYTVISLFSFSIAQRKGGVFRRVPLCTSCSKEEHKEHKVLQGHNAKAFVDVLNRLNQKAFQKRQEKASIIRINKLPEYL
jgi:hypothetical protein